MSEAEYFRPTLLVGVGGTGGAIAERVFLEARRNNVDQKDRIGVLVFDTELAALQKLKSVPEESRVQISTADPVSKTLRDNPDAGDEWFFQKSDLSQPLLNMSLLQGSGQIRMLTRLALHDSFRRGTSIAKSRAAIARIAANDGRTTFSGVVNILVVGSLTGATGSGSFYQIALMMRELCRQANISTNMMGLFLLPDVFIRPGKILVDQIENVQVNAYASLKELNALNVITTQTGQTDAFTYSYMPNTFLRFGENPFAAVTLMDFEASRGGNMGPNLQNYIDLAARAAYLLIFSPLGPSFGAVFVNSIQTTISNLFNGRHNLFSGLGVATLSYPAESMRDHLAYKLVLSKLDGNWIRLDDLFRLRIQRFVELKAAGQTSAEEPRIDETYLRDLEILAEQSLPFFRDIWRELHPEVKTGTDRPAVRTPIAKTFVEAFIAQMDTSFRNQATVERAFGRQGIDGASLKSGDEVIDAIKAGEHTLNVDLEDLDRLLQSEPETIFNSFWTSADEIKEEEWRDSHLKKWMIKGGPHPVRNRAFLFQVRREILDRLARIDPRQTREELFVLSDALARNFSDKETAFGQGGKPGQRANPAIVENAERIGNSGGGLLGAISGRFVGSKRAQLVEAYVSYYASSLSKERELFEAILHKAVLERLLQKVEGFIKTYVGLFGEIDAIGRATRATMLAEEQAFSGTAGGSDGNVRVYADRACREAAWKKVSAETASSGSTAEVNRALSHAIHEAQRISDEKKVPVSFNDLGQLFRRHILDGYGKRTITENYGREWDITVIEAVKREAEVLGIPSWMDHLADRIRIVSAQAEPYISLSPDSIGQSLKFWALHPESEKDFGSKDDFTRLTTGAQGEGSLVERSFSRHELYCVNFRLNLTLDMFTKLSDGDKDYRNINATPPGVYQLAYSKRIEEIIAAGSGTKSGRVLTPHTHRDWHLPGALPEIVPEKGQAIRAASLKATVVSILFGLFKNLDWDSRAKTQFSTLNRLAGQLEPVDREVTASHDLLAVVQAFIRMTDLVRTAERFWSLSKDATIAGRPGATDILGVLLSVEPVERIVALCADRTRGEVVDTLVIELVSAWCHLVNEAVTAVHRQLSYDARKDLVTEKTGDVRNAVLERLSKQYQRELAGQFEVNFDKARGKVLSEI